ncbi:type II secretion system F family protein [Candidatus Parcubacteria bacterium]|uniref:Type II secretion system protein GspF domain-containing protein n=1 Tax=Candidatus Kaiserbacteria bacterium CG10_big_fil_rev_8_21_14_0_10_47_16 TaxID=1974608 RepID=A0A2H0UFJ8_9BACT|nr:type II secretion system F family protein [Candidatus Parcubacteria bacterium]PIR84565.1 MAG: hypothetical protein COU16_03240 [Candidatus Kaiserbacteria bacterium CG10_big_fil_rev_8_21_14_0_10_47_16]
MEKFTYIGTTKDGEPVTETVDAVDRFAVYDIARENGHLVTKVKKAGGFSLGSLLNVERINILISRVKEDQLVMATRNLGSMLKAGLPLSRALSVIERQSKNPRLQSVMRDVRERISKGDGFHDALARYPKVFSPLYVAMVRAGEESGSLAESLQIIGQQLEQTSSLKKKVKGAMIYPAIVISVMGIIGVLMMIFVIPSITETFKKLDADLPTTTRILIGTSDFMSNHAILTIGGMILVIAGFIYALRTRIGKRIFHFITPRLPVIGTLVKETNSARTARTLSSLLSSGVDMLAAIEITQDVVQNIYYKQVIAEAAKRVEKGSPLSEVFVESEKLYPILLGEMILVGEETGQISKMLDEVAIFYETEVTQKTKDLSTIIEPVLMVFIGGVVGFFALAMIAPIYSISDSIG